MLGSFGFHWRSRRPEHRARVAGSCSPTVDDDVRPTSSAALAVGGAGWRARMLATVPSNLKNPAWLADQAEALADEHGLTLHGLGRAAARRGGLRRHPRRRPGLGDAAAADPPRLHAAARRGRKAPHGRAGRQGHHLRHRRPLDQAGRGDGQHEARHDRRRRRDGGDGRAGRVGCPVRVIGLVAAAENAVGGNALRPGDVVRTTAAAPPRSPTPTPRAGWCWPTRWRTPSTSSTPTVARRRRHADRRDQGRARPAGRRLLRQRRRARRPALRRRRGRRASRCGGCPLDERLRGQARPPRSPTPNNARRPGRDHGGPVPPALRRRRAVGPPRHRLGRRLAGGHLRVDDRARPASAPARC